MYINSIKDIEDLIGRRAEQNLLHSVTGQVLVEQGKLITRSVLKQIETSTNFQFSEFFNKSNDV